MKKSIILTLLSSLLLTSCGQDAIDENEEVKSLTFYCWSISSINTAKKTNTAIYKKVKEASGVDITAKTVNSSAYDEAINKLINTRELPDVFVTYGPEKPKQYKKLIDDEAIVCVSDYATETDYPNLYKHLQEYKFLEDIYYTNGKQYCIPTNFSLEHSLYIRNDWIDNLNKTEKLTQILTDELGHSPSVEELEANKFIKPTTILEFYRVARAFTLYDPDENGKNDTYGYTGTNDLWSENWIYIAFANAFNCMVKDSNGKYTTSHITEGTKKALQFINKLQSEGIMHPDWQTDTFDNKQTKFCQGKVGIIEAHNWFNNIVVGYRSANPSVSIEEASTRIAMINPPSGQEGYSGISGHPGFWTAVCINKNMSQNRIKKALKVMDYLYSDEGQDLFIYGVEGVNYKTENNKKVSLMGTNSSGFNYTVASYDAAYPLSEFCNWTADYFSPYSTNAEKINNQMNQAKEYSFIEDHPFFQTPKYVSYFESMNDYADEKFLEIITNSSNYTAPNNVKTKVTWDNLLLDNTNLNNSFNSFKNKYLSDYRGQEVIDEYNEYLSKVGK